MTKLTPTVLQERLGMGGADVPFVRALLDQLGFNRMEVQRGMPCWFGCGQSK